MPATRAAGRVGLTAWVRQTPRLGHLFTPLRLGSVELPNRIVSTAHQTGLVPDHLRTPDFIAYQEARARGGTGLIVIERRRSTRRGC